MNLVSKWTPFGTVRVRGR